MSKNAKQPKQPTTYSYKALTSTLFFIIFIILPLTAIYITGTNDIGNNNLIKNFWIVFGCTYGIGLFAILLDFLLVKLKVLNARSFNFSVPMVVLFCFMTPTAYVSGFPLYARVIVVFVLVVIVTLLMNILITKIEAKKN
ncbi:MAG3450 family membrane protein [Mycoplasmopsis columbinasalis]|uniref:Uncharacterized protein n=1 Tax=Mycoplasmopsis columbinasalis TaxID=114880 RepID=A0A449BB00_9BACT|nr:hypothetical protein [Mycoplasmopsis columbinasalis]VEU78369.1 Uncharacterised protein [Mycoplasmopsis columbinasalis]